MSTPSGATGFPTLDVREGHLYVVRKDNTSTIIGQAASIRYQSNIPTRKIPRIGDTNKYTSFSPAEHSVNLEIYAEQDAEQLAKLLAGSTKPATGGWTASQKLYLNPSVTAYTLWVDQYNRNTGSGDTLEGAWELKNFKPSQMAVGVQAEGIVSIQLSGECDEINYQPAVGIGA